MSITLSSSHQAAIAAKLSQPEFSAITERTKDALKSYIFHRLEPGYTLRCVLEGEDVVRTVLLYHGDEVKELLALCQFLHWEVPSPCHGSKAKVRAWLADRHDEVRCERCGVKPAEVEESRLCQSCEELGGAQ
jgi:hypothetical protein